MARVYGGNFPADAVSTKYQAVFHSTYNIINSGFGFIVANWVTYGCDKRIQGVAAWRLPLGLQMLPATILFLGMVIFNTSHPIRLC